jgi:hypothetical protein
MPLRLHVQPLMMANENILCRRNGFIKLFGNDEKADEARDTHRKLQTEFRLLLVGYYCPGTVCRRRPVLD